MRCEWFANSTYERKYRLYFTHFSTESPGDHLIVFADSKKIIYTGDQASFIISFKVKVLRLLFLTDGSINKTGFRIQYTVDDLNSTLHHRAMISKSVLVFSLILVSIVVVIIIVQTKIRLMHRNSEMDVSLPQQPGDEVSMAIRNHDDSNVASSKNHVYCAVDMEKKKREHRENINSNDDGTEGRTEEFSSRDVDFHVYYKVNRGNAKVVKRSITSDNYEELEGPNGYPDSTSTYEELEDRGSISTYEELDECDEEIPEDSCSIKRDINEA